MNKDFLFKQILSSTIKKLKIDGFPILKALSNYDKLLENKAIYNGTTNSKEIIEKTIIIGNVFKKGDANNTITFIENDITKGILLDYFVSNLIISIIEYYSNNEYSTTSIAEYINGIKWINSISWYNNNKLVIVDLRNLYMLSEIEQEKFIINMFDFFNKRNNSRLYNIILINDSLRNIIKNNNTISSLFNNTIIIK